MADYVSTLTGSMMDVALTDMAQHTSEAWAVGKRNGIPVEEGDPTYHNNAKYWAEQFGNFADTTLYVNGTTGSDTNDGSEDAPYKTIQAAVNSLPKYVGAYHAQINIASGTYTENVTVEGFYGAFDTNGSIRIVGNATIVGVLTIKECNCSVDIQLLTISPQSPIAVGINIDSCSSVQMYGVTVDCENAGVSPRGISSTIQPANAKLVGCTIKNAEIGLLGLSGLYSLVSNTFQNVVTAMRETPLFAGQGTGIIMHFNSTFIDVITEFVGKDQINSEIVGNTLYITL